MFKWRFVNLIVNKPTWLRWYD